MKDEEFPKSLGSFQRESLRLHLELPGNKSLSYLPIRSISRFFHLSLDRYIELAVRQGHAHLVIPARSCRIVSGAIYVFHERRLDDLLSANADLLRCRNWPVKPVGFIREIARILIEDNDPVLPIIRQAFGDIMP